VVQPAAERPPIKPTPGLEGPLTRPPLPTDVVNKGRAEVPLSGAEIENLPEGVKQQFFPSYTTPAFKKGEEATLAALRSAPTARQLDPRTGKYVPVATSPPTGAPGKGAAPPTFKDLAAEWEDFYRKGAAQYHLWGGTPEIIGAQHAAIEQRLWQQFLGLKEAQAGTAKLRSAEEVTRLHGKSAEEVARITGTYGLEREKARGGVEMKKLETTKDPELAKQATLNMAIAKGATLDQVADMSRAMDVLALKSGKHADEKKQAEILGPGLADLAKATGDPRMAAGAYGLLKRKTVGAPLPVPTPIEALEKLQQLWGEETVQKHEAAVSKYLEHLYGREAIESAGRETWLGDWGSQAWKNRVNILRRHLKTRAVPPG
jgi:hypothetical protein